MKKTAWFALSLLLCLSAAVSTARADSQNWNFTSSNNQTGAPCTGAAPCGQVTLSTQPDGTITLTVTSLLTGYVFQNFFFNFSGAGVPNMLANTGVSTYEPCAGCYSNGFGTFSYLLTTSLSPSGCVVTGGVPGPGCTMTVRFDCGGFCSLSEFEITTSGTSGSGFFSGELYKSADFHGDVGGAGTPIDEPATLSVLGSGLLFAGTLLRRRLCGFFS